MTKKYNQKLINQIQQIVSQHPKSYAIVLKSSKYQKLYQMILDLFESYDDITFNTKLYWILNDIHDYPVCKVCKKNHIPHDRICHPVNGYRSEVCSQSCAQKNPEKVERQHKEAEEKFGKGIKCVQQTIEYKEKLKKKLNSLDKEHWNIALQKRKQTCIEKYGVDNISKDKKTIEKKIETIRSQTSEKKESIVNKIKQTKLERYGNENFVNSQKGIQTRKQKFEENPNYYKEQYNKRKQTCIEKYGVEMAMLSDEVKCKVKQSKQTKYFNNNIKNARDIEALFTYEDFMKNGYDYEYSWKCKKCKKIFKSKIHKFQNYLARCEKCNPVNVPYSKAEKEIADFIKHFNIEIICSSRDVIKPKELDIYIPSKKLAIEYDGLYWHSTTLEDPSKYHLDKTIACEKKGIQLIHVFENEWIYKQNIVKSRIKNLLGIYDKTVFARKCEVREVPSIDSKNFQNENHIQGAVNSKVNLGLYFQNELISLMTFSKPRFDKSHEWELVRFCNKLGYHIPGGASKLLKHFERTYKPKSLVSYADRRWSRGKLYEALSFKLDHISKPDYWYWKHSKEPILESRIKYQKHKLKVLLENFDPKLSEFENMKNNDFYRIYDCGNLVFIKNYSS